MKALKIFSATWCVPCQNLKKVLQDTEVPVDNLRVYDVDQSAELAKEFGIRGVPTLILLEDGVEIKRKTGAMSREQLLEFVS